MDRKKARIRRARRTNKNREKEKIVRRLKNVTLALIVCMSLYIGIDMVGEYNIRKVDEQNIGMQNYVVRRSVVEIGEDKLDEDVSGIEKVLQEAKQEYMGYEVIARLEIPEINLETEVLSEFSEAGLEKCVSKFYGPDPNEAGNFVIIGHNYLNTKMFKRLKELQVGGKIYLTDNKKVKDEYMIYDIYKVDYRNVECLAQTKDQEITLVTCVNYTNERLVVKARKMTG